MNDKPEANHKTGHDFGSMIKNAFRSAEKTVEAAGHSIHNAEKAVVHTVEKTAHDSEQAMHDKYKSMLKGFDNYMDSLKGSMVGKVQEVGRGGAGYAAVASHMQDAGKSGHGR